MGSGRGNKVTHNFASASGYAVNSVMDCAFHANNFVAQNICVALNALAYSLLPNGVLYTCVATPGGYLGNPVFIK